MISIFNTSKRWDVAPPKLCVTATYVMAAIVCILYAIAFCLYTVLLCTDNQIFKDLSRTAISIVEIVIALFSVVISVIATRISDHYTNTVITNIEQINRNNSGLFNHKDLTEQSKNTRNRMKTVNMIRRIILILFLLYSTCAVVYFTLVGTARIQVLTLAIGAVSTFLSIILGLVSTLSCAVSGQYTNLLLSTLAKDNNKIFNCYVNEKIDKSYRGQ